MGRFPKLLTGLFRDFRNSYNEGVDKIDAELDLSKKRIDDLIAGSPQPSEVVDARGGFPVLRDRMENVDALLADKAKQTDLATVQSQIGTLVANAGNSSGNSEIIDIRTGASGKVFTSAGEAVRGQLNNLTNVDSSIQEFIGATNFIPLDSGSWEVGTLSSGVPSTSTIRLRSKNFIPVIAGKTYRVYFFNADYQFLIYGYQDTTPTVSEQMGSYASAYFTMTFKSYTHYLKFLLKTPTDSAITLTDLSKVKIFMICEDDLIKNKIAALDAKVNTQVVSPNSKLRVMSYNTGKFGYGTQDGMNDDLITTKLYTWRQFLGKAKADFIGMQEARNSMNESNTVNANTDLFGQHYPYNVNYTDVLAWDSTAMRCKNSITGGTSFVLSSSYSDTKAKRNCVKGYITVNGKSVLVLSVHLSPASSLTDTSSANGVTVRNAQMQEIISMVRSEPYFIICGDFNAETGVGEFQPFKDAGFTVCNGGYWGNIRTYNYAMNYTSTADKTIDRYFDNIIVSPNIRVDNFETLDWAYDMCTSDHVPVIADLTIM